MNNKEEKQEQDKKNNQRGYRKRRNNNKGNYHVTYRKYLSKDQLINGINNGELYYGQLYINASNTGRAYVRVPTFTYDVVVEGKRRRNRALKGDIVVVKLDAPSMWRDTDRDPNEIVVSPTPAAVKDGDDNDDDENDLVSSLTNMSLDESLTKLQPVGSIVGILEYRKPASISGVLKSYQSAKNKRFALFSPIDSREPCGLIVETDWPIEYSQYIAYHDAQQQQEEEVINDDEKGEKDNEKKKKKEPKKKKKEKCPYIDPARVLFAVNYNRETWYEYREYPSCVITKTYGYAGTINVETEALLDKFDVDYDRNGLFPEDVIEEVEQYRNDFTIKEEFITQKEWNSRSAWEIPDEEIKKRRDLRKLRIFSIDPITAKDLDDACSIEPTGRGNYRIGVHIADVTYFVRPDTALDREAKHRATTIYLVQRAIPMLPPVLCENLCSLNPGEDRLAFSVFFTLTSSGELLNNTGEPWYGRSIIRSSCKLDYGAAQLMIDTDVNDDMNVLEAKLSHLQMHNNDTIKTIMKDVKLLDRIAKMRRRLRFENGSLSLNRVKMSFQLDEEGLPMSVGGYQIKDSNKLIEEYMLLANMMVARRLIHMCKDLAFLRHQPSPPKRKLDEFTEKAGRFGYPVNAASSGALHKSIQRYHMDNPDIGLALEHMATHPMLRALYICAGELKPKQYRHYALAFSEYTHFTSPIRRYADVIVHRLLQATLDMNNSSTVTTASDTTGTLDPSLLPIETKVPYDYMYLSSVADQCNRRKYNAKGAQDQSDIVFLCYLLQDGPLYEDAVLVDMGKQSFEILIPRLGMEERVSIDCIGKTLRKRMKRAKKKNKKKARNNNNNNDDDEEEVTNPSFNQHDKMAIIDRDKNIIIINWPSGKEIVEIFGRIVVRISSTDTIPRTISIEVVPNEEKSKEKSKKKKRNVSPVSSRTYESVIFRQEDD